MITVLQADAILKQYPHGCRPVACALTLADGRILQSDIVADRDSPAENCSAMDGIAMCSSAWERGAREFRVLGVQKAGAPQSVLTDTQACFEVMTGALIPKGSDTVIPVESLAVKNGTAVVHPGTGVRPKQFVRHKGKNFRAGDVLLKKGMRLNPFAIGVCASAGYTAVLLNALPRIAFVETGDEITPFSGPVLAHQVRSQNAPSVETALRRNGFKENVFFRVKDDEALLQETLADLLAGYDMVLLSGGVSMGQYDFGPRVLERLGVKPLFHKVCQRPGKPLWFGVSPEGKPVFGLPGNPVSTLVCLYRYVLPYLLDSAGVSATGCELVRLAEDYDNSLDLTVFLPVKPCPFENFPDGKSVLPCRGSDDTLPFSVASGFVEVPAKSFIRKRADPVLYRPWTLG